jgi:hypothetical protein
MRRNERAKADKSGTFNGMTDRVIEISTQRTAMSARMGWRGLPTCRDARVLFRLRWTSRRKAGSARDLESRGNAWVNCRPGRAV